MVAGDPRRVTCAERTAVAMLKRFGKPLVSTCPNAALARANWAKEHRVEFNHAIVGNNSRVPPRLAEPLKRAKQVPVRDPARTLEEAVSRFGTAAEAKLSNPAVTGQPEDQLRGPVERLIQDLAWLCMPMFPIAAVGETPLPEMMTRPDFAITCSKMLVGFVELKAPGARVGRS